jgi:hypothetical protein
MNRWLRPMRTRGSMPVTCGTEPAQVTVSMTSSLGADHIQVWISGGRSLRFVSSW